MATCPCAEAQDLDIDEFELEPGDVVTCSECGATLGVSGVSPAELELISDEDDDPDDEDDEDDDDDFGDEDDEVDLDEDAEDNADQEDF